MTGPRVIEIDAAARCVTVALPRHRRVEIRMGRNAVAPSDALISLLSAAVPLGPTGGPGGPAERAGDALRVFADLLRDGQLSAYLDATVGNPRAVPDGETVRAIVVDLLADGSVTVVWAFDEATEVQLPRDAFCAVVEAIETITAVIEIDVHKFLHVMSQQLPEGVTLDMGDVQTRRPTTGPWPTPGATFVTKGGQA